MVTEMINISQLNFDYQCIDLWVSYGITRYAVYGAVVKYEKDSNSLTGKYLPVSVIRNEFKKYPLLKW